MTSDPIDKVARALLEHEYSGGHLSGAEIEACIEEDMRSDFRRKHFTSLAIAALRAIREPTEAQMRAMLTALGENPDATHTKADYASGAALTDHCFPLWSQAQWKAVYRAAIDKALEANPNTGREG
jgi:hypothetical protein